MSSGTFLTERFTGIRFPPVPERNHYRTVEIHGRGGREERAVSQSDEFLAAIGHAGARKRVEAPLYDPYRVVLEQVLELDAKEFEILVGHLLTALGFEGSEVTGKSGDGGVDATGELSVSNLAKVKVFVQAKRYKLDAKVSAGTVRQLPQAIPFGGQGAFITTADYQAAAA